MRVIFSTDPFSEGKKLTRWTEMINDRFVPVEQTKISSKPFRGVLEVADFGPMAISRVTQNGLKTESTAATLRRHEKQDSITVAIKLFGTSSVAQSGRDSVQQPGDMVVIDRRPSVLMSGDDSASYLIEMPRWRVERSLGSTRDFSAVTIGRSLPGTSLVRTFINELLRVHNSLSADMAQRMASVGIDLIVAGIAEGMARQPPVAIQANVLVQRAKVHIEAHLGDVSLDPASLAAGIGVSLRRLQELFQAQGHCVSEWIWQRRLEEAAKRLADPACAHVPIGVLCYDCGFSNQAHFSRRFRAHCGRSPSEFRREHLAN